MGNSGLKLPENVLALVAGRGLERWSKHVKHLGTYAYAYGAGFWVPNFPLKNMAFNARAFRKFGVKAYHAEVHPVWAFDAPKVFILSKLLWDPDLDVNAALRKYCDAAFGKGGAAMADYYRRWARLRDNDPVYDGAKMMCPMRVWRSALEQLDQVTSEDYEFCRARIADARVLVTGKRQRGRLDMAATFFDYSRVLFTMHTLCKRVFAHGGRRDDERDLQQLLAARRQYRATVKKLREHPEWLLGTGTTLDAFLTGDARRKTGWPLRNNLNSAIKTTLFLLAEAGKGKQTLTGMQEEDLKLYCMPLDQTQPHVRVRKEHPWYEGRSEPMSVTLKRSVLSFRSKRGNIRFTEGSRAGTRKPHHAMATVWVEPAKSRKMVLCDMRLKGRNGRLKIRTLSFIPNTGWSPIWLSHTFGPKGSTARKRLVSEPVFPVSDLMNVRSVHDVHFLWQPHGDDAQVEGSLTVRQIFYPFKPQIDVDKMDVRAVEKADDKDDLLDE